MSFTIKDWQNSPAATTPLSAEALEDMETRLSNYSDSAAATVVDTHSTTDGAHAATAITVTPTGLISATNVQTALVEVATEAAGAQSGLVDLSPQADGLGLITGAVAVNAADVYDGMYAAKLSGNATITVSNLSRFAAITFRIVQSTAGSNTVTFAISGGSVRWPSATAGVLTTTASAVDYFTALGSPTGLNMEMFTVGKGLA